MARVAWDVAREMKSRGYRVSVLCGKRRPDAPDESEHEGIRIVRYNRPQLPSWHPRRAERLIESAEARARSSLRGDRPQIVHMHSTFTGVGAIRAMGEGPRYVYTMHSPAVLEQRINWASQGWTGGLKLLLGKGRLRRIERTALEPSVAIQTLSEYTRRQIEAFHGMGSRVTVIPHWRRESDRRTMTKAEARRRLGWSKDEPILFTIRRHGPRYGLDLAIQAAAPLLPEFKAWLVVAGDGPLRKRFEELAQDLNVQDRVSFPGRLSDEDLSLAYQAADLFILPTLALECFGLIIIEAFSYGCPVLSSDVCAIPETMKPIMPDFLFPTGNVEALRAKLLGFLAGKLVAPPSEELVEYVDRQFSWEALWPRMASLLEGKRAEV